MSHESDKYLGKILVLRTSNGDVVAVGKCFSYTDVPTIQVQEPDGSRKSWRADMTTVLVDEPELVERLIPTKLVT